MRLLKNETIVDNGYKHGKAILHTDRQTTKQSKQRKLTSQLPPLPDHSSAKEALERCSDKRELWKYSDTNRTLKKKKGKGSSSTLG